MPCVRTIKGGRMFKSILIPTDGSKLSDQAVRQGLQLAKSLGAKVVALHVTAPFHVLAASAAALTETREQSEKGAAEFSKRIFDVIAGMAREAGVACTCHSHSGEHVWQEIIMAAEKFGCDAICMASHGRRGIGAVLIGSETVKVLTHSKIPVLVVR
ncbi:MAG: universal stress protein [Betaproteobacteria bacterium]|nr:MAG: universal stress protein [Betaproteobacteria bacterium]